MSNIIRPLRWWDIVSPQGEQEMIPFLRTYMGKGKQFRTPKRMWEDMWRLKRGEMNHVMGMRKFGSIKNFKGPKFQQGILHPIGFWAPSGTEPALTDITHSRTVANPSRIQIAYDSDGTMEHYFGGNVGSVVWTQLTTQTDDSNDHTSEWWPDSPETNEGLNWEIRYTNLTNAFSFVFQTGAADRTEDQWYVLDDVSNDHVAASREGALVVLVTGKSSGTTIGISDVEIRVKETGSAVASHNVDITAVGTG